MDFEYEDDAPVKVEPSSLAGKLIRYYGLKTPEEIGVLTGLDPMTVAKATEEALGTRDYLGEDAEIRTIIFQLKEMVSEVMSRIENASDRNLSGLINSARAALASQLKTLERIQERSQVDVNSITEAQGRVLGEVVDIAVGHLRSELKERYGAGDDEMDELISEGMSIASQRLADRVDS